jgi:hypothetical protein
MRVEAVVAGWAVVLTVRLFIFFSAVSAGREVPAGGHAASCMCPRGWRSAPCMLHHGSSPALRTSYAWWACMQELLRGEGVMGSAMALAVMASAIALYCALLS